MVEHTHQTLLARAHEHSHINQHHFDAMAAALSDCYQFLRPLAIATPHGVDADKVLELRHMIRAALDRS